MIVSVIPAVSSSGSKTITAMLSAVYSRTQKRTVSILSTGSLKPYCSIIQAKTSAELANMYSFKNALLNAENKEKSLFFYGVPQGSEPVYIYDILDAHLRDAELIEAFDLAVEKLPTELNLVILQGDLDSDLNRDMMSKSDCCLIVSDMSSASLENLTNIRENLTPNLKDAYHVIINKVDYTAISIKEIQERAHVDAKIATIIPYSNILLKNVFVGTVDRFAYDISRGAEKGIPFRSPIMEIMQFIFEDDKFKLRGVQKWYS